MHCWTFGPRLSERKERDSNERCFQKFGDWGWSTDIPSLVHLASDFAGASRSTFDVDADSVMASSRRVHGSILLSDGKDNSQHLQI